MSVGYYAVIENVRSVFNSLESNPPMSRPALLSILSGVSRDDFYARGVPSAPLRTSSTQL